MFCLTEMFCEKGVLKHFAQSTGKRVDQILFNNNVTSDFLKTLRSFEEHLRATVSELAEAATEGVL